jgi:Tfp pilus assembly protein PilN
MELAGDEKRIQALFSELSLEDQRHAPRFEKLWRAGEATSQPPRFSKSLIAITAAVIVTAVALLATWTSTEPSAVAPGRHQAGAPSTHSSNQTPIAPPATPPQRETQKVASVPRRPRAHSNRLATRQKQIDRTLQQQAALLANWQSPTDKFMTSPASSVFNSLPQLNQSAKDLESFLPKNHESLKESNR